VIGMPKHRNFTDVKRWGGSSKMKYNAEACSILLAASTLLAFGVRLVAAKPQPNIVLILCDGGGEGRDT
jgi:hypothetical protein